MKRLNFILLILVTTVLNLFSQEVVPETYASLLTAKDVVNPLVEGKEKNIEYKWEFLTTEVESELEINTSEASNYRLGEKNSLLKDYINQVYTKEEPIAPGNPMTRIVIRKPAIFNAVKTIERYYIKSLKGKEMSQQEVEAAYQKVLQVAIAAASENSESFEDALQEQRRNAIELVQLFNLVKLKQM